MKYRLCVRGAPSEFTNIVNRNMMTFSARPMAMTTTALRCSQVVRTANCTSVSNNASGAGSMLASRRGIMGTVTTTALWLGLRQHAAMAVEFQTAPNGLQWIDTVEGQGPTPVKGALIRCHYTGRLKSNGKVFDSSYERGRPLTFKIGAGEVIRGWDLGILGSEAEGIPSMKEGGKRTLVIPSDLAYGQRGAGGVIPPNAVLEFDVELLGPRR
ncbi:hypothetical protein CEUSTIGMA_g12386.t1 [Chlamydomonas eustigma]|uniref:peptidylprolyl isomerase n=1 Tax=Chlamydomonas eustigma TaxID=1157962 RepID=A0A250XPG6_9CHLO|nr:hypothetical protein CEUSTIGMA_g12386.t1 [Chlamydomonas eustigma]|eukprot:GAX84965.1 hypothetical protein CEUSTIGMA_g12386.t1 [Chlamydomonas eustigma]